LGVGFGGGVGSPGKGKFFFFFFFAGDSSNQGDKAAASSERHLKRKKRAPQLVGGWSIDRGIMVNNGSPWANEGKNRTPGREKLSNPMPS